MRSKSRVEPFAGEVYLRGSLASNRNGGFSRKKIVTREDRSQGNPTARRLRVVAGYLLATSLKYPA